MEVRAQPTEPEASQPHTDLFVVITTSDHPVLETVLKHANFPQGVSPNLYEIILPLHAN